jgi:hypothetical protein
LWDPPALVSANTALAAVKTSIDPATPEAKMPSYTHILIRFTALSDIAQQGVILPSAGSPDKMEIG